jgi:hypothetical protein
MMSQTNKVGVMISETLRRRATEVAQRMETERIPKSTLALFEDGEPHDGDGEGLISTSETDIPIILGSIELEGKTYYIGLPKNDE